MDEKVGKMSVRMTLREEVAKVQLHRADSIEIVSIDAVKERKPVRTRGKEESL